MTPIKLSHTTHGTPKPLRGGTSSPSTPHQVASPAPSTPDTRTCNCPKTSSPSHISHAPSCLSSIIQMGKVSSSQDGIIVSPHGIAPVHTAGHGNCPKILIEYNI